MGEVRFGTAGWVFDDWYGTFYPAPPQDDGPGALFTGVPQAAPDPDLALAKRQPLRYYARFFDLVEVNSSFYGVPRAATVEGWAQQTERREPGQRPFEFSLKLHQAFTHEGWWSDGEVGEYLDCLAPLRERDRLAAVLAQFPHSFEDGAHTRDRIARLRDAFPDLPLVVELRHTSWRQDSTWAWLRQLELGAAWIDQPQDGTTLGPDDVQVADPRLGYVRLHGRNAQAWFDPRAGRDDKYDYLYTPAEVEDWDQRIRALTGLTEKTVVIANNHFRGKAPANALELRKLAGDAVEVPRSLLRTYPRLADA